MMHKVFISLGSNLGDREKNLKDAVVAMSSIEGLKIERISNIYETEPVGYTIQDRFLNMVVSLQTVLTPSNLLEELQIIEQSLKRVRKIRWGPRTIDLDILLYNNRKINLDNLVIPHPRMFERAFVLIPLRDVYMGDTIFGRSFQTLIELCDDKDGVKLYKETRGFFGSRGILF